MFGIDLSQASLRGDPRWIAASTWTRFAPTVVLSIFALSIIELAIGIAWVAKLGGNAEFVQFIQPIIVPALALFNSVPSAHLHILARVNAPLMAMYFSSILCILFLASAVIYLGICSGSGTNSVHRNECPQVGKGTQSLWDAMVALQLLTAVGYAVHFAMAWRVRRFIRERREGGHGGEGEGELVVDPVEKERREAEARERWRKITAG